MLGSMRDEVDQESTPTREFEFLFVVDGVSMDDDKAVALLTDDFDAVLSWNCGRYRLAVSSEGRACVDAAVTLAHRLAEALPCIRILHLDHDLVGISDIAQRTGRSRQNVLQWTNGERNGSRPFPAPEGSAGRSPVWRWADVNAWLTPLGLGLGDGAARPTRAEAAVIDYVCLPDEVAEDFTSWRPPTSVVTARQRAGSTEDFSSRRGIPRPYK
jgi:hypothetical protein